MTAGPEGLDRGLIEGSTGGVRITKRRGEPWISVPKLDKLVEPENLTAIKDEVARRWGTIDLLDVLLRSTGTSSATGSASIRS
ncbi:hypothetical protein AB0H60_07075 [Nocardia rhamnosiphila]|uniref:hypothetical protein n=1 Tax=Nocardia rhamnosiphila TaxID=426716 RepID=UPI0033E9E108